MNGDEVPDFFTGETYLKRLGDLENPLPLDSPIFLPPRPDSSQPETEPGKKKEARKLPIPLSEEEKGKLKEEYYRNVQLPATTTMDTFPADCITEVLQGKAWVVPGLLSEEECEQIVQEGEEWGLRGAKEAGVRTSKRTSDWDNEQLSVKLNKRLPEELLKVVEATAPYTSVRGIHPNWRVARYQEGETFPAHVDQADSVTVQHPEKKRQRFTSSHTLLIYLKRRGEQFQGGATRLFPTGSYSGATTDVCLPQGCGLVFQQRGLLHAGLPVDGAGAKYIAQAGVLRAEAGHVTGAPAIFKYGPGLATS
eukprot:GFUD01021565.1.p1 GENE.GFUD01021565.1~~GFUD01021565.1.p1  ORF type:complete len:308 (+),score=107.70 GFUD01021565.1:92-1015(+)